MAYPNPTSPSQSNPTIGNPFNTEATVLNTLLTSIKADWTANYNYFTTTGLETAHIADRAVTASKMLLTGVPLTTPSASPTVITVKSTVGTGTEFISDNIVITTNFADAFVEFISSWAIAGESGVPTEGYIRLYRDVSPITVTGQGTNLALNDAVFWLPAVAFPFAKLLQFYSFWDTDVKAAGTYYYRFTCTEIANGTAKVAQAGSNYAYKVYNGLQP